MTNKKCKHGLLNTLETRDRDRHERIVSKCSRPRAIQNKHGMFTPTTFSSQQNAKQWPIKNKYHCLNMSRLKTNTKVLSLHHETKPRLISRSGIKKYQGLISKCQDSRHFKTRDRYQGIVSTCQDSRLRPMKNRYGWLNTIETQGRDWEWY